MAAEQITEASTRKVLMNFRGTIINDNVVHIVECGASHCAEFCISIERQGTYKNLIARDEDARKETEVTIEKCASLKRPKITRTASRIGYCNRFTTVFKEK